ILSPELLETIVAQGSNKLEIPSGVTAGVFTYYGYNADPGLAMIPVTGSNAEFHKTEPDKNVYLVLKNQKGADPSYDYGTHFLFQGHETGVSGYLTRINLDADAAHRITLMANADVNGAVLPTYDGITWYPFSQRLLLTSEGSLGGGVWQATLDAASKVEGLTGILGQGGYEGIQADSQGRLIIVEDAGGSSGAVNTSAKRPNSFIFRFLPTDSSDLQKGGKLQALQVKSLAHSGPISFNFFASADAAILSQDVKDMHTYGLNFDTAWVTVHDTAVNGTAPFNANALAKAKDATPFKRPENGQFRPGSNFSEFVFDETGDTNINTQAGTTYGGFGAIFRLRMSGDSGTLSLVYNGDAVHAGFDNCAFWDRDRIVFVEDAGDTLHTQRNGLDSAWLFDLNTNYSGGGHQPIRILAQGRDVSATIDSQLSGSAGFVNEGDNEITGWHHSNGDPTVRGLLGAKIPKPFKGGWRLFYTQQHGDNITFEVFGTHADEGDDED
ncbi:MAG: phosphatase, partial [Acidobacteriota bacterium]